MKLKTSFVYSGAREAKYTKSEDHLKAIIK